MNNFRCRFQRNTFEIEPFQTAVTTDALLSQLVETNGVCKDLALSLGFENIFYSSPCIRSEKLSHSFHIHDVINGSRWNQVRMTLHVVLLDSLSFLQCFLHLIIIDKPRQYNCNNQISHL